MHAREQSPSENYFWPTVWALALHIILFGALFVSYSAAPELPPAKPIIQATLYQLNSKSPATVQTNQKLAGAAQKTAAPQYEVEQLELKKQEQQKVAAAKAAEQKKQAEAQKAEAAKKAEAAAKAEQAKADQAKAEAAKKAEAAIALKKAEEAKLKAAEDAKKKAAEDAKKKAAEEAKKKAAEDAKKKAAEEAKKKTAQEAAKKQAAEDAKKKAAQEAARKAAEDRKAQALAELLSDTTERQATVADEIGDTVVGNLDDLIRLRAAEGWNRPPSARSNMVVQLRVNMLPDGTITNVAVVRSSGDGPFDNSAVAAVRNIGRITEMQQLKPNEFNRYRSFTMTFTPEDLAL